MSQTTHASKVYFELRRYALSQRITLQTALEMYASERILYRLSQTKYAHDFVLKGAMMLVVWVGNRLRSTRDVDLRGFGSPETAHIKSIFGEIASLYVDDGLIFDISKIRVETIKAEDNYPGLRITLPCDLHKAHLQVVIEIGFSDVISPSPESVIYPALLPDQPVSLLRGYPKETAIAEKFSIMLEWGELNTRLKDFYDVLLLSRECAFDGLLLTEALQKTLEHRHLAIPDDSAWAFTDEAGSRPDRQRQWRRYLVDTLGVDEPIPEWPAALIKIKEFLLPPCIALRNNDVFSKKWSPKNGWLAMELS